MEVFELNTKVISGVDCLEYFNQYKNQGIFIVCDKFLAENQSVTRILKEIDDSNKVVLFTDAVSYTHLDLYKRQVLQAGRDPAFLLFILERTKYESGNQ